ncbi:MAG: PAS domain S-box protein [Luteibaculaceae bacterium]
MKPNLITDLIPNYLLNSENTYVIVTDLMGLYLYVNPYFAECFNFIEQNFIGKPWEASVVTDDHDICLKSVRMLFENPQLTVSVNLRKPSRLGQEFSWSAWEFSILHCKEKQPIGVICLGHDISTKELKTREVKKYAQRVNTILNQIEDGFLQLNSCENIAEINSNALNLLGLKKGKSVSHNFWELLPELKLFSFPQEFSKARKERKSTSFTEYIARTQKWLQVTVYPTDEGLTILLKDITQEKIASEQIQEQQDLLRAVYDSSTEGCTLIDKNGVIKFNNKVDKIITKAIFGVEAKPGDKIEDFTLPELRKEFSEYYEKVLKGESISVEKSTGENWWRISLYPVYTFQNEIMGIALNIANITEKKTQEVRLQQSELQLHKTIEAIPHPMLLVNSENTIDFVNEEFTKVFQYTEVEIIGEHIYKLIPQRFHNNHPSKQKKYMDSGGKSVRMGRFVPALRKDGTEIMVDASLNTFTFNGKLSVIVILNDVTQLKEHQDLIVKQNTVLKQIAWHQSHELRAPVANILGIIDLIKNHSNTSRLSEDELFELIEKSTVQLDELIAAIVKKTSD